MALIAMPDAAAPPCLSGLRPPFNTASPIGDAAPD